MDNELPTTSDIRAAKKHLSALDLGHVLGNEVVRRYLRASDHTDRCTGHVHGPCDCGHDLLVEIANGR